MCHVTLTVRVCELLGANCEFLIFKLIILFEYFLDDAFSPLIYGPQIIHHRLCIQ